MGQPCPRAPAPSRRQATEPPLPPAQMPTCSRGLGALRGCLPVPALREAGGQGPHRDDGVSLALLRQVAHTTHEEPVGGDVGLAGLDHAAAQLDQLQTGRGRDTRATGLRRPSSLPSAGAAECSSGPGSAQNTAAQGWGDHHGPHSILSHWPWLRSGGSEQDREAEQRTGAGGHVGLAKGQQDPPPRGLRSAPLLAPPSPPRPPTWSLRGTASQRLSLALKTLWREHTSGLPHLKGDPEAHTCVCSVCTGTGMVGTAVVRGHSHVSCTHTGRMPHMQHTCARTRACTHTSGRAWGQGAALEPTHPSPSPCPVWPRSRPHLSPPRR